MAEKDSSSSASGPVLGINLGNSNSCVAVWVDGRLQVIPNQGSRVTPSFVAFTDEGILVGSDALQQFPINPENTITGMKRLVGRTINDPLVHKFVNEWSFKLSNIAPAPKGAGVVVTFCIDEKGMLEVSATDEKSGKTQRRPISQDAGRLSKEQISQIISKTDKIKSEDENMKIILSAKNELEEYANLVIDKLEEQSLVSKLGDNKQDKIRAAAKDALEWSGRQDLETDKKEFETRMDNLKEICKLFMTEI